MSSARLIRSGPARAALLALVVLATALIWARSAASVQPAVALTLKIDATQQGSEFEAGAVGLSIETRELGAGGLRSTRRGLVRQLRLLGPSVLRIGGDTVDTSWWTSTGEPPPPWATNTVTPSDLSSLRALLVAAGWRVLLGVNLGHFEPTRAADEASYAQKILGPSLLGIEIGNEPNSFGSASKKLRPPTYTVSEYLGEAQAYLQAVQLAAPGVPVYGPALTRNTPWLGKVAGAIGMFSAITQHYYAVSTCTPAPPSDPAPTAEGLLSPAVRQQENETLESLALVGRDVGRPVRMGETNDTACVGSASASPTFASALWALDWSLRAASSGVVGLNFHGTFGACSVNSVSPLCAARRAPADATAQPEFYGLLAARQLEGGRFLATSLAGPNPSPDITAWATLSKGGVVKIAIDDLALTGPALSVYIPMRGYVATRELLVAPSPAARTGVTLGSAGVTELGRWRPAAAPASHRGAVRVAVGPDSAVILTLRPHRHRHR